MTDTAEPYLHWVGQELVSTLNEARVALEQYAEDNEQRDKLERVADLLHTAHGALHMVEIYGAALLAEEMVHVAGGLHGGEIAGVDEAMDALSNSMVQLPVYLDRVIAGGRDVPLVLLPLLNDLRAVRGTPLLTESTLFVLKLSNQRPIEQDEKPVASSGENIQFVARRLRPRYQAGLLGLIRGEQVDSNLATMAVVTQALAEAAAEPRCFRVWWVAGAVIEALRDEGLEAGASVKRLLGQVDRAIKQLIDLGEPTFSENAPSDLVDNLLYYVARATSSGDRVVAVKSSFSLAELLPGADTEPAEASFSLSTPSVTLMRTVAAAIKQDLGSVKDVLDIHVRTGGGDPAPLAAQPDVLRKIANTLAMLGLDELRDHTLAQIDTMTAFIADADADDRTLLGVAEALLKIEDRIDAQLLDALNPDDEPDGEADFREVEGAVLRECMVNLARVKEAITTFVAQPEQAQALDPVPGLMNGINAGLLMLDKTRAVEVLGRIGTCIRGADGEALSPMRLDQLADAIVSVEYYMETLQNGRRDPWYMLDNADRCLDNLDVPRTATTADGTYGSSVDAVEESAPLPEHRPETTAAAVADDTPQDSPAMRADGTKADGTPAQALPVPPRDVEVPAVDPELLELFIDEAREEIDSLSEIAPQWSEAPGQRETLLKLRRSFHTLKGSGRMVGAHRIGDYAWGFERLLNKVIDGTQPAGRAVIVLINAAIAALPELVAQLENGVTPTSDVDELVAQAERLCAAPAPPVEAPEDVDAVTTPDDHATAPDSASGMDPVLYDIFSTESAEHLATVYEWVDASESGSPPFPVSEALHRAWHTLSGTANTAAVAAAADIAAPMGHLVARHYESETDLPADAVALIRDAADAIRDIVVEIGRPGGKAEPHPEVVARIAELERRFDALEAGQAAGEDAAETAGAPGVAAIDDAAAAPESHAETHEPDFDAEIAAIFGDEATELLDASDRALQALSARPDDRHVVVELQRHLHTLKGGARMAGIAAMGNLSHELETLVRDIGEGTRKVTSGTIGLLQASVDRLHGMRDALAAGLPVVEADDVLARIAVAAGHGTSVADAGPTPQAASPAVDEPADAEPVADEPVDIELPVSEASVFEAVDSEPLADEPVPGESVANETRAATETGDSTPDTSAGVATDPSRTPGEADADEPAATVAEIDDAAAPDTSPADTIEPDYVPEPTPSVETTSGVEPSSLPPRPAVAWQAPERKPADAERQDVARVSATLLDELLNHAGEISIYHSRLEQQLSQISFNLSELTQTVSRLRGQLRQMEIETEAQMLFRHQEHGDGRDDFDPLELDRYSTVQQLSRALAESVSDLSSIEDLLGELAHDAGTLLVQQARVTTELQDGLMRTRMVPFERHVSRLSRLVRKTAAEAGKRAELRVDGAAGELDRQVLERMLGPLEHMLRNSIVHGIETPDERVRKGKPETGEVRLRLHREGSQMVLELTDDGAGLDVAAISHRAKVRGMLASGDELTDTDVLQFIVEPGFSTARELTQSAGRGVGMDVVANEVKQLGGTLEIGPNRGRGAHFVIRLPQTLAITQALLVRTGEDTYAIPLPSVEGIVRVPRGELESYLESDDPSFEYGEQRYRFQHIGVLLGGHPANIAEAGAAIPVILVRAGEHSTALIADEMLGSREVVVKPVGPQIAGIRGIAGATILGDGSIVVILDVSALVRTGLRTPAETRPAEPRVDDRRLVMVVDDSITVRRVTQRLLERNDIRVITAKDGVDAVSLLQEHQPDLMLLDIEMPRMDGYEVATHVRNSPRLQHIPIVMVTSRVGEKHRARAFELGVDAYLGKPYQEAQLLETLEPLLVRHAT